jgi:hypothetical protein
VYAIAADLFMKVINSMLCAPAAIHQCSTDGTQSSISSLTMMHFTFWICWGLDVCSLLQLFEEMLVELLGHNLHLLSCS